jgi:hypothetical protein
MEVEVEGRRGGYRRRKWEIKPVQIVETVK